MTTFAPGDRGEMRNGEVSGELRSHSSPTFPLTDGINSWRADGRWYGDSDTSSYDLVRRVRVIPADDPAPPAAPDQTRQLMAAIVAAGMLTGDRKPWDYGFDNDVAEALAAIDRALAQGRKP